MSSTTTTATTTRSPCCAIWRGLLPHEVCFGGFLLITGARLAFVRGFSDPDTVFYLILIGCNWIAWQMCRRKGAPGKWRAGLLFYPLAMNLVFLNMKSAIPKLHPERLDLLLQHWDTALIGTNLSIRLQPLVYPGLTEFFSGCYILFFPYLLFSLLYYFLGDLGLLKRFVIGLFSIYGIGFLGYSLVPAAGPYVAMAGQFHVPLTGWWITRWNSAVVAWGSNGVDVFPSLHCAISGFILLFDRLHRPWRFKLYLIPCAGLWVSTIYLRYHYLVDVLCGFALALFGLWLAERAWRSTMFQSKSREQDQPNQHTQLFV